MSATSYHLAVSGGLTSEEMKRSGCRSNPRRREKNGKYHFPQIESGVASLLAWQYALSHGSIAATVAWE